MISVYLEDTIFPILFWVSKLRKYIFIQSFRAQLRALLGKNEEISYNKFAKRLKKVEKVSHFRLI